MMKHEGFAALILAHGRPDRVYTVETLRRAGYTGRIVIVVDNEDPTAPEYLKRYGDQVYIFNKIDAARDTDSGDNFGDRRGVVFARNSCFKIAAELGLQHFIELDDDYTDFRHKRDGRGNYIHLKWIRDLDAVFDVMLDYFRSTRATSIAMAQGGDFFGGAESNTSPRRKVMNSFICSVDRPFKFYGRSNEDLTTSVLLGGRGALFLTFTEVALQQKQTQQNAGGMTELYLDQGTYVKSLYSVIYAPSAVKVSVMHSKHARIHHRVSWRHAVPVVLAETLRKPRSSEDSHALVASEDR
jgi:TET-Associated Glycosyltransferase